MGILWEYNEYPLSFIECNYHAVNFSDGQIKMPSDGQQKVEIVVTIWQFNLFTVNAGDTCG